MKELGEVICRKGKECKHSILTVLTIIVSAQIERAGSATTQRKNIAITISSKSIRLTLRKRNEICIDLLKIKWQTQTDEREKVNIYNWEMYKVESQLIYVRWDGFYLQFTAFHVCWHKSREIRRYKVRNIVLDFLIARRDNCECVCCVCNMCAWVCECRARVFVEKKRENLNQSEINYYDVHACYL